MTFCNFLLGPNLSHPTNQWLTCPQQPPEAASGNSLVQDGSPSIFINSKFYKHLLTMQLQSLLSQHTQRHLLNGQFSSFKNKITGIWFMP